MKRFLLSCLLFFIVHSSFSQINYIAANAVNTAGTYTDLGINGIPIASVSGSFDDDNSLPQNIGFSFEFNGTVFTQFVLNTNGVIKLGAIAPADAVLVDALASSEENLIYPLNLDLQGGVAPEYRVYTSGVAPNRVCTIQFKDLAEYDPSPTEQQFASLNFQIKLFETSNNIEFVYGSFVGTSATVKDLDVAVGIKGSTAAASVNAAKEATGLWSSAGFINGDYTAATHNIRYTVLPDAGRTYRFVNAPILNNDAQVSNVYTLSKIPFSYGAPHTVSSRIENKGIGTISNLVVTLNITGANTFTDTKTILSLPAGDVGTVSFAGFTPVNVGTNVVTVSVASDDNNNNNSIAANQEVNTDTYSYADNATNTGSEGYGAGLAGMFVTKFSLTGIAYVNNVNIYIPNLAVNEGKTIYAVVLDPAGAIIGQSANYVITAGDLGAYKSFTFNVPPFINGGDFFAGLAQTADAVQYFPLALQSETPARPATYYTVPSLAGGIAPSEITSLGKFMVEAVVSINALPVKISGFSGTIQNNNALLSWLTYEKTNDQFQVEKSAAEGTNWTTIGTVTAFSHVGLTNKYTFTDAGISSGKWMYRLKIIDKAGKFTYSPIIVLQLKGKSIFVLDQNYPNPVLDVTMIRYELASDALVSMELYSMDGKKIMAVQKGKQLKGAYNIPVNTKSLAMPAGKYMYRMLIQDAATGEVNTLSRAMTVVR
jgi:trimeric autotransporter adhesin